MAYLLASDDVLPQYARTQKNKATSGHLGLIKAKLAKLKRWAPDQAWKSLGCATAEGRRLPLRWRRV